MNKVDILHQLFDQKPIKIRIKIKSIKNIKSKDPDLSDQSNSGKKEPYKNLVLSGGSVKAIAHTGALRVLVDHKLIDLKNLNSIAGTSAGALYGLLLVLGFDLDEIWDFLYNLDFSKLVKPDFFLFFKKCGIETGKIFLNLIEDIIYERTQIKHITFRKLYELTKIHYIVVGTCLTTKESINYDHINTPNFKVSIAIRISIGMPGFFTPIHMDGKKYIDGGLLNNYPMNLFQDKLDETIGINISGNYHTDYQYPEQFVSCVMNLFMFNYFREIESKYVANTVQINEKMPTKSPYNFNISLELKNQLYEAGVIAGEKFVKKILDVN